MLSLPQGGGKVLWYAAPPSSMMNARRLMTSADSFLTYAFGRVAKGHSRPEQASEDRRIMATCREQNKTMPDRVLKAQALPHMKERAERVEDAPDREKPKA